MSAAPGTARSPAGPGAPEAPGAPPPSMLTESLLPEGPLPRAGAADDAAYGAAHAAVAAGFHQVVAAACRVFAAQPMQIAHARRFISGVLSGFGASEDIVLCVCELASNAVLHSSSRQPGGQFTVRVTVSPCGRIRAEVTDRGGPWSPDPALDEEHGRGLLIVNALASRWGITGSDTGRSAWLELDPGDPDRQ
jgi:serine/threonine-protein kinase RsbW